LRKTYLDEFIKSTDFSRNKKNDDPHFFMESLKTFIKGTFKGKDQKRMPSVKSMQFFLGSIFYPKKTKQVFKNEK
jgi:hypothetical protein